MNSFADILVDSIVMLTCQRQEHRVADSVKQKALIAILLGIVCAGRSVQIPWLGTTNQVS